MCYRETGDFTIPQRKASQQGEYLEHITKQVWSQMANRVIDRFSPTNQG